MSKDIIIKNVSIVSGGEHHSVLTATYFENGIRKVRKFKSYSMKQFKGNPDDRDYADAKSAHGEVENGARARHIESCRQAILDGKPHPADIQDEAPKLAAKPKAGSK